MNLWNMTKISNEKRMITTEIAATSSSSVPARDFSNWWKPEHFPNREK